MALSQTEKDLEGYTYEKLCKLISDVAQSFDIAGLGKPASLLCVGAVLLKVSIHIAVTIGAPRDLFLARVGELYDQEHADQRMKGTDNELQARSDR